MTMEAGGDREGGGGDGGRLQLLLLSVLLATTTTSAASPVLYTTFSWGGLRGNITFSWGGPGSMVRVEAGVELTTPGGELSDPVELDWGVHEFPVRYDTGKRCGLGEVGARRWDLSRLLGKLVVPQVNGSQVFETDEVEVVGAAGVWGRSLRVTGGGHTACSNLHGVGGERTYEARFNTPVGGSVWVRTWAWDVGEGNASSTGQLSTVFTDLFHTAADDPATGDHNWALFLTDILDVKEHRSSCNFLSRVYDPAGREKCGPGGEDCPMGDLTSAFGSLRVAAARSRFSRKIHSSTTLVLPDLTGPRQIYLAIMGALHPDHLWACAKLRPVRPREVRAVFNAQGVTGHVGLHQESVFTPTDVTLALSGLRGLAGGFHVHELPAPPPRHPGENHCARTKGHYNPYSVDPETSPEAGLGAHDHYELGDLSGKHGQLLGLEDADATVTDHNLPLFGPRSVVARSLVIHDAAGPRWVCANLRPTTSQLRASVTFRYPLVGDIIFEQDADDPLADTTILVTKLVYSDGSRNSTGEHRWQVHDDPPGRDFYNWTMRCVSAGPRYNPYKVSTDKKQYQGCGVDNPARCELGDLSARHGALRISGTVKGAADTQMLLTDTNLPLSGPHSILAHSIVIHDDHAPKHRGDRMACMGIHRVFRHKGVVSKWQATRGAGQVEGKLEFIQESEFDITQTEVELRGLEATAAGYHVHMVPVESELEFPCAGSTTLGHYNPLNVTPALSPPPTQGTHDQYEMGDLAGKYGGLSDLTWLHKTYNDSNLQLFGSTSIMGRSVVIHKRKDNARWFCGSIGWGYSPSEARQVSAIASFHNPNGYAEGYVRMRQLVYMDGSFGETFIEVNLKHPGKNNRNVTRRHNWSVYVNPVGVDAGVKFFQSRCVAAGYRWNPYLIHLAFPNDRDYYERECGPDVPLRCDVGDLSGRLGTIDVGDKRFVFVDRNLPLSGPHGVMNRAIVIHKENAGVERFACANIQPDDDIIKWVIVRKAPKFSVPNFMADVREVLGAPRWYLAADLQTVTLSSDQQCVTFVVHFMGPSAGQLELDFSRLLAGGILTHPTISIRGVYSDPDRPTKVPYRSCGGLEEEQLLEEFDKANSLWKLLGGDDGTGGAAPLPTSPLLSLLLLPLLLLFLPTLHNLD
ncbi:uncharacterized protein LOC126985909 [Eriocheir sinensis]|uniref:uncharacterized protein LOC126985909 n=1 Tax=Eriocheir sinensis TaxID=95602 RepID=UPI0021C95B0F|nr:uncharacterized protein LOC126985909 [Eriocheir sinensis]